MSKSPEKKNNLILSVPDRHREEVEALLEDLQEHLAQSQISHRVHRYEVVLCALRWLHQFENLK